MTIELWLEADPDLSPDSYPSEQQCQRWIDTVFNYLADNASILPASIYLDALKNNRAMTIAVRVVGHNEGQALNAQYRARDYATNVLSFPAELPEWANTELDELPLGDLIICAPVVTQEAQQQGKLVQDHWLHLLVHGCLHLLGLDHIEDEQADAMEALEVAILAVCGCNNPYIIVPSPRAGVEE
jgi:probable rRNA maturation factor